jgi:3-oxoacyl-[acyl-carrier-protein] synthase-1
VSKPSILSVGARSPLGLSALQTSLVWRSGKLVPSPLEWVTSRGHRMASVRTACLPEDLVGTPRLVALAAPALREAAAGAGERARGAPLLLATGEPKPGFEDAPSLETAMSIALDAGVTFDRQKSAALGMGHAGFGLLLERAVDLVTRGGAPAVIVGAVDSYHHADCMKWLDDSFRLHAEGSENGIIPSEGAAFVVVAPGAAGGLARVSSVACALEEGHEEGEAPDIGHALCDVVRRAASGASARPVPWLLTDMNGERHRVRRWSFVKIRNKAILDPEETVVFDGPDEMGDPGAALGGLLAVHACVAFATGHADGRSSAMIGLSSEARERAAFVLEAA